MNRRASILPTLAVGLVAVAVSTCGATPSNPGRRIVPDTYAADWTRHGSWWSAIVDSGFAIAGISLHQQSYAENFVGDSLRSYGVKVVYNLQPWLVDWQGAPVTTGEPDSLIWLLVSENDSCHFIRRNTGIIAKVVVDGGDSAWVYDFRDTSFARRLAQIIRNQDPKAYGYYGDYADLYLGIEWCAGLDRRDGIPLGGNPDQFWADWVAGYRYFFDLLNDDREWCACWRGDYCEAYDTYCSIRPMEGIGPYRQNFFTYQKADAICRTAQLCGKKGFMFCEDTTHADYRRVLVAIKLLTDAQICWRKIAYSASFTARMPPELAHLSLGLPAGDPYMVADSVYRRDFSFGYVLANFHRGVTPYTDPVSGQIVGRGDGLILQTLSMPTQGVSHSAVQLAAPVPNPTIGGGTAVAFSAAAEAPVLLQIYDLRGRLVRTLWKGRGTGALQIATWDGADDRGIAARPGVYFVKLLGAGSGATSRLVRLP